MRSAVSGGGFAETALNDGCGDGGLQTREEASGIANPGRTSPEPANEQVKRPNEIAVAAKLDTDMLLTVT